MLLGTVPKKTLGLSQTRGESHRLQGVMSSGRGQPGHHIVLGEKKMLELDRT